MTVEVIDLSGELTIIVEVTVCVRLSDKDILNIFVCTHRQMLLSHLVREDSW